MPSVNDWPGTGRLATEKQIKAVMQSPEFKAFYKAINRGGAPLGNRNAARTHCKRGHDLAQAYCNPATGFRACRLCKATLDRQRKRQRRAAASMG